MFKVVVVVCSLCCVIPMFQVGAVRVRPAMWPDRLQDPDPVSNIPERHGSPSEIHHGQVDWHAERGDTGTEEAS